ncbi:MAG: flotillin family protein [Chloroflexia bacterium]
MDLTWFIVAGLVFVFFAALILVTSMFRKVGPNEALIVYGLGMKEPRVVKGGGTIVVPMVQTARSLSLELMSFDVAPTQDLYTRQGVAVTVEAVAQIKVKSDPESIRTASEQFLNKTPQERENLIRLVMEGHLRGIVGQLSVEEIVKQPEMVADKMRATSAEDMAKMGLEIISFTIKDVRDQNDYIVNMSKPENAAIRRAAAIAEAEASRDIAMRQAQTMREASVAKAQADQERVIAETASSTKQAEAQRDLEVARADYTAKVQRQKAASDKAYDIESSVQQQQVVAAQVGIERVQREEQIKVQDAEILRVERELIATVLKQAEIEKKRVETLADAERQRRILEAQGAAEAVRLGGGGQADASRVQGLADADVIRARGQAEADAMHMRAGAFKEYNEAAVLDKLISTMPEVIGNISRPLSQVDKITIVSTGDGSNGMGAHQLTGDITRIVAQFPALVETLTGVKLSDLMSRVAGLDTAPPPTGNGHSTDSSIIEGKAIVGAPPPDKKP